MKIDYSKYQTTPAIPEASSMIETFRAIGYSIEAAVADIIDNSISASAKNIWVNFDWLGTETWLAVKDDGIGMDDEELIQAMKPGSKNPLSDRDDKDLGRFGLGLKTASFSQCRQLTVLSKKSQNNSVYWTWDLDFVNQTGKWELIKYLPSEQFDRDLAKQLSGTIVVWNTLDRLVKDFRKDDNHALDKFLQIMEQVKRHLAMVFHRFLESGKVKIFFQDRQVEPWNPFLVNETATQSFPDEPFTFSNGKALVKGYVLPHKSKLTEDVYKIAEGPKGWNEQQGFYIYRNDRLLVAGDWLGMYRKEEHYKLARIEIQLPNTLDSDWQIDIKKSIARPPLVVRDRLKAYAGKIRSQAVEVYRHRGKNIHLYSSNKFTPLWIEHKRGDKWFYKINREHPLIENVRHQKQEKEVELLLRFIEETIPIKSIYIKEAEEPENQGKPFEGIDHDPIKKAMKEMYGSLISKGKSDEEAKSLIVCIEPFNSFPHFFEFINLQQ